MLHENWLADVLLIDGDPTQDVSILQDARRILMIMKDGVFQRRCQ
jgi:imidazolonepropionase-like amidohydrolase